MHFGERGRALQFTHTFAVAVSRSEVRLEHYTTVKLKKLKLFSIRMRLYICTS